MIHDLDASLRALVRRDALEDDEVDVAFDAPTREWAGKRSSPTVSLYLFDIREDTSRRRVEPERVHDEDGKVIGRRRPPRRYRLSYLVTAWTQRPEDEHRLLSSVLGAFLPHEEFPRELLQGSLADDPTTVYLTIGLPPPPERSIGEIWSAMGGELKPSLELVANAPFVLHELRHAGEPVTEEPRFTFDDGQRVEHPQSRPFPGPRQSVPKDVNQDEPTTVEETVRGGKEDSPGRVMTIGRMP